MLDAVKRYATKILLIHLVLLVVVIFFVIGAARQVQVSAREEAQTESKDRLQLLAEQTALGLESHYQSIMQDLDVILREEMAATSAATTNAATIPTSQPEPPDIFMYLDRGGRGRGRPATQPGGRMGRGFAAPRIFSGPVVVNDRTLNTLWRQLKGRVSQLFLVDTATQRVLSSFPANSTHADASALALTRANITWLKTVKDSQMSAFKLADNTAIGEHTGYHLVAVPAVETGGGGGPGGGGIGTGSRGGEGASGGPEFGGPGGRGGFGGPGRGAGGGGPGAGPGGGGRGNGPNGQGPGSGGGPGTGMPLPASGREQTTRMVVAVVPIDKIRELFLDHLNDRQNHEVSAILVNDAGQVLVSSSLRAVGSNLLDQMTGQTRGKVATLVSRDDATDVLNESFKIGDTAWDPQVVAAAQLEVPSGHHWTVLILSPLADAENAVNRVFSSALLWAVIVSLSMTGILVSTSVFMIRSRMRFERTRHDILTRELEQARQIQLAWLPDLASTPPDLEVWAANLPASHISGDFYNWFRLPRRAGQAGDQEEAPGESSKIGIVIGDVTGHGMAAAFLMATTQLLVRMTLTRHHDAARCLREVNQQLCAQAGGGFRGQFVTMLVMVLDPASNSIEVATAGHPTPLVQTRDGFKGLELEPQLVLGVDAKEEYKAQGFILEPGASVLLYTDGVVEAEAESGEQFGVERLVKLLAAQPAAQSDPEHRIRAVLEGVKKFCGQRDLLDDVTLVAIRTSGAML